MSRRTALACAIAVCCCSRPAPPPGPTVVVEVRDDEGRPLPGVPVLVDGAAGDTDQRGRLRHPTIAAEGSRVEVEVRCPAGWGTAGPSRSLLPVRHLRAVSGPGLAPLRVSFVCSPPTRRHVLLVRAGGQPGLPVMVTGEERGRTDGDGIAHVILEGPPGLETEVVIDTREAPRLRPASPGRRFRLPRQGQIIVLDQPFEERRERRARGRRRPRGPRRL